MKPLGSLIEHNSAAHLPFSPCVLHAGRTRLLAERDDLNAPFLSSKTQAQREGELTQLNGKLYTVAKAQFDKRCPAVATGATGSVVR